MWLKWNKVLINVLFYMSRTENYHFYQFLRDFLFVVKSSVAAEMPTMFGDVTGLQQRHHS